MLQITITPPLASWILRGLRDTSDPFGWRTVVSTYESCDPRAGYRPLRLVHDASGKGSLGWLQIKVTCDWTCISSAYRECQLAEKETAKIEKMTIEDGDGKRLWELSERCLKMQPGHIWEVFITLGTVRLLRSLLYKGCGFCYCLILDWAWLQGLCIRLCERERAMVQVNSRKKSNLHLKLMLMYFKNLNWSQSHSHGQKRSREWWKEDLWGVEQRSSIHPTLV